MQEKSAGPFFCYWIFFINCQKKICMMNCFSYHHKVQKWNFISEKLPNNNDYYIHYQYLVSGYICKQIFEKILIQIYEGTYCSFFQHPLEKFNYANSSFSLQQIIFHIATNSNLSIAEQKALQDIHTLAFLMNAALWGNYNLGENVRLNAFT